MLAGADGFELHFFESFVTPEGATRAGDWVDSWSALHAALGDDDYDWDVFAPPTVTFYAKEIMPFVQRLDHHAVPFRAFQYLRPGTDRRMHSALVNVPFTGLTLEVTSEQSLARNESARFRHLAPRECPPSLWLRSEPAALDAQLDALGAAGRNALGLHDVRRLARDARARRHRHGRCLLGCSTSTRHDRRRQAPHRGRQAQSGGRRRQRRRRRRGGVAGARAPTPARRHGG